DGKTRTASFDICAVINYQFYYKEAKISDWKTTVCEFFTERSVLSGLLAAGPDIVGKRKHAVKIVRKNAVAYLFRETHGNKIFD
ncbi:MAG TPA: hypothetical protein VNA26_09425, partial [Chitinophagaceae bacterium]|nr:hypothetical protein [Chitinophagaceae bacterium]